MNTVGGASPEAQSPVRDYLQKQASVFGASSAASSSSQPSSEDRRAPGGIDVIPVLCLNTWQHVWLRDYGLGASGHGGKTLFAERWWDAVDWDAVAATANVAKAPRTLQF